jgi:hypothetical protein
MDPQVINFNSLANHDAGSWAHRHRNELPLPGWSTFRASHQK